MDYQVIERNQELVDIKSKTRSSHLHKRNLSNKELNLPIKSKSQINNIIISNK